MHCQQCGTEAMDSAKYCHQCGAVLTGAKTGGTTGRTEAVEQAISRLTGDVQPDAPPTGRLADEPEAPLWHGTYSAKGMVHGWILATLLTSVALGLSLTQVLPLVPGLWVLAATALFWGWLGLVVLYRKLSVRYQLTNQRFMHYHGLLHRYVDRIEVIDMDDVSQDQSLLERFLNVGRIKITGSDRTHPEMVLRGIDDVARVSTLFDDARRKERLRRGIYMESI